MKKKNKKKKFHSFETYGIFYGGSATYGILRRF